MIRLLHPFSLVQTIFKIGWDLIKPEKPFWIMNWMSDTQWWGPASAGNVMTHIWPQDSSYNSSVIHVLFPPRRTYLTDRFTFPQLYIKESKLLEMTKSHPGNLFLNTFGISLNLIQQIQNWTTIYLAWQDKAYNFKYSDWKTKGQIIKVIFKLKFLLIDFWAGSSWWMGGDSVDTD